MRALLALSFLAGCYEPELRDCAVACSSTDECADGHVCAEGLCRAPNATCEPGPGGGMPEPREVLIRVVVDGEGMIVIPDVGTCRFDDSDARDSTACDWRVIAGTQIVVEAHSLGEPFDGWTSSTCAGQDASCSVVVNTAVEIKAKFK